MEVPRISYNQHTARHLTESRDGCFIRWQVLWTVESGRRAWFAGTIDKVIAGGSGRMVPMISYDDGVRKQLGPRDLWRRQNESTQANALSSDDDSVRALFDS